MDLDNLCGLLPGVIAIGAFGALFVWAIVQSRKQDAALREIMTRTGFSPLEKDDPQVVGRAESIYRTLLHPEQRISIRNLYSKRDSEVNIHVLDIDTSGTRRRRSTGKLIGRRVVLLTAPDLRIPRLYVYPKMTDSGMVAAAAVGLRVMQTLAFTHLFEVDFDDPDLQRRYQIMTDDPQAAKAFLTSSRLSALMGLEPEYGFDALDDTLVVQSYFPKQGITEEQQIAQTVQAAQLVLRLLREE